MPDLKTPFRIEPTRLEEPSEAMADLVAEIAAASTALGGALHPKTAANLANLVRVMNCYYSNLIEGYNTHPRDIERGLLSDLDEVTERRNLQLEAAAGLLASETPKGPVSLRFPQNTLETLFPRLYPQA